MAGPSNRASEGSPASPSPSSAPGEAHVAPVGRALRPKDAATLILVDRRQGEPRILMGRRRSTQVFLPDKYVFPGGRVDRADRAMPALTELSAPDQSRLLNDMKGAPSSSRIRALALAAVRETFEETGLIVGARSPRAGAPGPVASAQPPVHATWQRFVATGYLPCLSGLRFLARAITPPARPRRYDTRFFLADAALVVHDCADCDDELRDLGWFTLDEIRALDLPNITRAVIEDLAQYLATPDPLAPIPYYRFQRGTFRRDLIT